MGMITPVIDRTQADVNDVKNKVNNPKGTLSVEMLNRIENNCDYLATRLNSYSYPVTVDVKLNWTRQDYPRPAEMERIRQNVSNIREAYYALTSVPSSLDKYTYDKINDIEKILAETDFLLSKMELNFVYSGVATAGQNRTWQQRFRRTFTVVQVMFWNLLPYTIWQDIVDDEKYTWKEIG